MKWIALNFKGFENVRRWIFLGPVQLNVSLALAPILLFALAQLKVREAMLTSTFAGAIYFFQPDASQATAFAFAAATIFVNRNDFTVIAKLISCFSTFAIAAVTWLQKDTLPAVPHVENSLRLVFSQGILFVIVGVFAILLLFLPLILVLVKSKLFKKRNFVGSLLLF